LPRTCRVGSSEAKVGELVERSAESIRSWIITGKAWPGERLSEKAVAETLAVSRNTLRAAEPRLAGDSEAAAAELDEYLLQSERTVAAACSRRTPVEGV